MIPISIVVPLYNEQDNVGFLHDRLVKVFKQMPQLKAEFILVDDGSQDRTWEEIERLRAVDSSVKGIKFSRNFGQQNALTAGLDVASGDAVVTMDGDLQQQPELIPEMVAAWRNGCDIVYARRRANKDYGLYKKATSYLFSLIFNKWSSVKVEQGVVDFRLMSREVVASVRNLKERNRFVRGLVGWVGYKSIVLDYVADHRHTGTTKYSFSKALRLALSSVISFSPAPLYFSGLVGLVVVMVSFVYIFYALCIKFFTPQPLAGWTSILISVLFLGGIQLLAIGVLGSYLALIYEEVKGRPSYIIQKMLGIEQTDK